MPRFFIGFRRLSAAEFVFDITPFSDRRSKMDYFIENCLPYVTLAGALVALLFALFSASKVLKFSEGNDTMKKISP